MHRRLAKDSFTSPRGRGEVKASYLGGNRAPDNGLRASPASRLRKARAPMHQIVTKPLDSTRRWWVLAIVVAAQFMFGVDAFIVNVAIPTIAVELKAAPALVESVVAIYLIA